MAGPLDITNIFGNLGGMIGGFNLNDLPAAINSWAAHVTGMGQLDIIGLITLGLCVFNIGIALAGILNVMAMRRRRY